MANTGGIIELSPEQLASQGQEMLQLKGSYERLFQEMVSDIKGINDGWSELLAHNFESKIASAQQSFSGVAKMLQNGAFAAVMSANNIASQDKVLGDFARGGTIQSFSKAAGCTGLGETFLSGSGLILDSLLYPGKQGKKEGQTAVKAYTEMGGDVLSFGKNLTGYMQSLQKGNFVDAGVYAWGIVNNVYAFGADSVAVAEIGLGRLMSAVTGDDYYREVFQERAEKDMQMNGFTDVLQGDDAPEWMQEIGKYTDIFDKAVEGKKLYNSGKKLFGDAREMEKVLGSENLTDETKMSYVKEVIFKNLGVSPTDHSDESVLGHDKNQVGFFGNVKNLYDWGSAVGKGEVDKVFMDKFKLTKFGKDAEKFIEGTTEVIYSWTH